ncbi:FibroRumin family radical SAM-modified Cys-rich RiPP [Fibrobacter succinogenes]|uniref:FibroRumin family radical SAM-modified Cys-rich RiPP n=1 Tax=Fibrobacter succinogenes TaxID=833 RepID=UPI0009D68829
MVNYSTLDYEKMFGVLPSAENAMGSCIGQCTGCMCSCRCSCSGGCTSDVEWEAV